MIDVQYMLAASALAQVAIVHSPLSLQMIYWLHSMTDPTVKTKP
jgi:hypothetical protein